MSILLMLFLSEKNKIRLNDYIVRYYFFTLKLQIMKKKLFIALFAFVLVISPSYAGNDLPEEFAELLKRAELTFKIPENFIETEIVENSHMLYEYALKHPTEKFEVRYAIRPIDDMVKEYDEWKKNSKEGETKFDPRALYPSIVLAVASNISADQILKEGGKTDKISSFPEESVRNEFGADAGMTGVVRPREGFSSDYKHCMVVAINKKDKGTAFCFYLFDDPSILSRVMLPIFHNLRFD